MIKSAAAGLPRLLVVDDEEAILDATRDYFTASGYWVDCAREREEAEALLATEDYELVISDMRLTGAHGREGLELLGLLRERCPRTRTIVLTAYRSPELEGEVMRRGADSFLQKPIPLAEVARTARRLLGQSS